MLSIHTLLIFGCLFSGLECAFRKPLDFELKQAEPCSTEKCQPPHCRCSGMTLPKKEFKGHEKEIPQFITVTFDDAVNAINYEQYQELFNSLLNPDHCEVKATFYVSHEYTDYSKLNALYNEGHEIALHSITHGAGTEYWRQADVDLIMREFGNQIDILEKFAKINRKHIRGMRLPFLQISGNNTYVAAKRLGLLYDSSWPTQQYRNPAMWPYTLDYLSVQDCQIRPCPTASLPGLWVYPMVTWVDKEGYSCSMLDGCIYLPEDKVESLFEWMKENFHRHYDNNRAPFGMFLHAAWFGRSPNYIKAFRKFLEYANSLPDVYITTPTSVIQYMKHPTLGKPFKGCFKKPQTSCRPISCALQKQSTGETRYMTVCDNCPEVYPWLDNPLGEI
ncbi:chitin deacetylase 8 [Lucilia sericata]|uniref:chitin deacetylase 8 n=1 Tax=Lucilia sericata TaxID=13632 RepID=UPI0018A8052F|nr:chitin deacetylase 8 [Lucilia sericata]